MKRTPEQEGLGFALAAMIAIFLALAFGAVWNPDDQQIDAYVGTLEEW